MVLAGFNLILTVVRAFLMHGVTTGRVASEIVPMLYEVGDSRDLPVEAQREDGRLVYRMRAHHRLSEPKRPVDRATDDEVIALLRACRSCRDRLIVLLMARSGLRRGELVGLRREDIHFMVDSTPLGCRVPRSHLHVVRRDNPNGAWAKSRRTRWIPVDFLVVQAYDQYVFERGRISGADDSDFVLVNLFRGQVGAPMPPDAVNDLLDALVTRAGLSRQVTPHMLRHAFGSNLMDAGASLDEAQDILGHGSASSTGVYIHPDMARLRAAVDRVPSPRSLAETVR